MEGIEVRGGTATGPEDQEIGSVTFTEIGDGEVPGGDSKV